MYSIVVVYVYFSGEGILSSDQILQRVHDPKKDRNHRINLDLVSYKSLPMISSCSFVKIPVYKLRF